MSLTPRNIVADSPDVMSKVLFIGISPISSSGEGSPIYLTIDATASVSGSYTDGDIDYAYSGSDSIPQKNRVEIRPLVSGVDVAGEHYEIVRDNDVSSWVDFGFITGIDTNEFLATQSNDLGCNGGIPPFAPPEFLPDNMEAFVEGTRTDNSETPALVTTPSIKFVFYPPYFVGSIQDGDLIMRVSLEISVNDGDADEYIEVFNFDTDASAWVSTDFRDIRGTYGDTNTDANGMEYTWSVTIG